MNPTIVNGPNYSSEFEYLQKDLVLMQRQHMWGSLSCETDVATHFWWLFIGHFTKNEVQVYSDGQWISHSGECAILLPPFQLIEWQIKPGLMEFSAYVSSAKLPPSLNGAPCFMPWSHGTQLKTSQELIDKLLENELREDIPHKKEVSGVAAKTKKFIDNQFKEEISMQEIAKRLNFNYRVMSRYFKKDFGISPLMYRNKLRVMNAKCLMLFNSLSVIDAAVSVGFSSPGGLNKAFKKLMALAPSQFSQTKTQSN